MDSAIGQTIGAEATQMWEQELHTALPRQHPLLFGQMRPNSGLLRPPKQQQSDRMGHHLRTKQHSVVAARQEPCRYQMLLWTVLMTISEGLHRSIVAMRTDQVQSRKSSSKETISSLTDIGCPSWWAQDDYRGQSEFKALLGIHFVALRYTAARPFIAPSTRL
jgi:hypothetical protein